MAARVVVSPEQCRVGRALLGWTQEALAAQAGVTRKTIADFEARKRQLLLRTRRSITTALETAGLRLLAEDGMVRGAPASDSTCRLA